MGIHGGTIEYTNEALVKLLGLPGDAIVIKVTLENTPGLSFTVFFVSLTSPESCEGGCLEKARKLVGTWSLTENTDSPKGSV